MARRIREEIVDDDEVVVERRPRRVVEERRVGVTTNPAGLMVAVVLAIFILVLIFGFLL
jgi:hypothetical protein